MIRDFKPKISEAFGLKLVVTGREQSTGVIRMRPREKARQIEPGLTSVTLEASDCSWEPIAHACRYTVNGHEVDRQTFAAIQSLIGSQRRRDAGQGPCKRPDWLECTFVGKDAISATKLVKVMEDARDELFPETIAVFDDDGGRVSLLLNRTACSPGRTEDGKFRIALYGINGGQTHELIEEMNSTQRDLRRISDKKCLLWGIPRGDA